jgi:hypothetical protein
LPTNYSVFDNLTFSVSKHLGLYYKLCTTVFALVYRGGQNT